MKKLFFTLILAILLILTSLIIILSTVGIETDKFNSLISKKINQSNNNINLKLNVIKFKLDIKEISLFLETLKPQIYYRNTIVPAKNIKVYVDFISIIKLKPKIRKINLDLEDLDINEIKKLSSIIKPSNFKSLINNKIRKGKLISELEIYFNENNLLENFIARGSVSNFKAEVTDELNLDKTNFSFFADKTDVLIKNIVGELDVIKISDGDIKLKLHPEISMESNFKTNIKYNNKSFNNYTTLIKDFKYAKDIISFEADLNNNLLISLDKTYKIKKYNYRNNGEISKANFNFKKPKKNYFSEEEINQLFLLDSKIKTNFSEGTNNANISGKYSINNGNFLKFDMVNIVKKEALNLKIDFEYNEDINLDILNYQKANDSVASLSVNLKKQKDTIKIKKINLVEKNNSILIEDLVFDKNKFLTLKKISVKTEKNNIKNNDFTILYGKTISIKGTQFDATNLHKILSKKNKGNDISLINKEIEIDFTNIIAPLSENLKNFKLIGKIEKGKFTKIISKGDFGENNFLDISIKNNQKNKKKYLEIYSDLTRPLLTEYSFFKGLTGGKLLYTSTFDDENSNSKLKIENFKVINAPGMIKLLSLADLGGLADLAEGEGLSFDVLEINMSKSQNLLKLNEILALGPSVSVLMEGYQDQSGITSLRGTLIPAKTLNKMISKIPLLGNIIIPKEVGEGLFGISFKMKGHSGKIKTTINPIKTITPRFIQKIIEKNRKSK
jgi:hypothetical protein